MLGFYGLEFGIVSYFLGLLEALFEDNDWTFFIFNVFKLVKLF